MELTKEETMKLHKELWDWLSKHPGKNKEDWPGWKRYNISAMHNCFLCQYQKEQQGYTDSLTVLCEGCIVYWPDDNILPYACERNNGIFEQWNAEMRKKRLSKEKVNKVTLVTLATQIRDLKFVQEDEGNGIN